MSPLHALAFVAAFAVYGFMVAGRRLRLRAALLITPLGFVAYALPVYWGWVPA